MDPVNIPAKFEVRSFIRSWDNRGYSKNLGSHWIHQPSLFCQIFKGLLFAWTLWIYLPSLKFVALPVPEIIGGTQKNLGSPYIRPRSIFSQIFSPLLFAWTIWIRDGSIPLFQNRYDIDICELKISAIPIYRRYFLFLVHISPIFTFRRLLKDYNYYRQTRATDSTS